MVLPKEIKHYRRLPSALHCPLCATILQFLQKHKSGRVALLFCPNGTCRYAVALQHLPKTLRYILAPQIYRRRLGTPRARPRQAPPFGIPR